MIVICTVIRNDLMKRDQRNKSTRQFWQPSRKGI